MTKISQITANSFGLNLNQIRITPTNTEKVANTSASAASASTDINGAAVMNAIDKIKNNLSIFIREKFNFNGNYIKFENNFVYFGKRKISFKKLISLAYLGRISLSSSGFYKTPKIYVDKKTLKGRPFLYFCYGAAVSEVIVDTLTGENKLIKVDILHDVGNSINPTIDYGQIEGAFVQGLGWLTSEEVIWSNNGNLQTCSPSTYKIPVMNDIPINFNTKIFKNKGNTENVVNKSKAVGEPPFLLAISTFFAIKNAIKYVNKKDKIHLNAPATPENILNSIYK
tara:strand:- start:73 stop:921 length:849 start_codon:yes stop_codon:yes gene_type:complete